MSLAKGDHVVIKRGEKIIGPEDEAYHEYEVLEQPEYVGELYTMDRPVFRALLKVVK